MQRLLFSDELESLKIVNVASVPQRSPFRYPGGKTWFISKLRQWLHSQHFNPKLLIEPFAGGGIVSLTALFEDLVEEALMVELDEEIAAVWKTIVDGDAEWLANRILAFDMTKNNATAELQKKSKCHREKAFQTIIKKQNISRWHSCRGLRPFEKWRKWKGDTFQMVSWYFGKAIKEYQLCC